MTARSFTLQRPRAYGRAVTGGQLGLDGIADDGPDARALITDLGHRGYGDAAIAAQLNAQGVRTPSGRGSWHASTVAHHRDPQGWADYVRRYRRGGS